MFTHRSRLLLAILQITQLLLEKGADLKAENDDDETPFDVAEGIDNIKLFLARCPELIKRDPKSGDSHIYRAALEDDHALLLELFELGFRVPANPRKDPMDAAAEFGNTRCGLILQVSLDAVKSSGSLCLTAYRRNLALGLVRTDATSSHVLRL